MKRDPEAEAEMTAFCLVVNVRHLCEADEKYTRHLRGELQLAHMLLGDLLQKLRGIGTSDSTHHHGTTPANY